MHYKQNNKESKTYVQGLRPFGNTLPRGVKGILKKSGYNYSEIISKWNMLVGRDISSCSYPKSIKTAKDNKNKTLVIAVKRGDEITVEYAKKEIISKINSYFGYQLLNEIRLETFSIKKEKNRKADLLTKSSRKFKEKINEIKNENIRNSLSRFLKVIKHD